MKIKELTNYTIELIRAAITDTTPQVPPENMNWNLIYRFANIHKLVSLINFAILKFPKDVQDNIPNRQKFTATWKHELFFDVNRQAEAETLRGALADADVDYIFLKGYVSKHLYPDTAMRSMGDMDVLYRISNNTTSNRLPDLSKIMEALGYQQINHTPKDDAFFNPINNTCIELHRTLVDKGYEREYKYLEKIWDKLEKKSEHEYTMSPEDFYIYHIIHMAKHVRHSGIGLLPFVDLWLFINHYNLDYNYLNQEFSALQLDSFELYARMLACKWFGENTIDIKNTETADDKKVLDLLENYIFHSGSYGTEVQMEVNTIVSFTENGNKSNALIRRIFPDKTTMVNYYGKTIEKHPWIIPFYWIYLNICRLFSKERSLKKKKDIISSISSKQIDETKYLLGKLFK